MHEVLGSIPAQARCIFEVLLQFYFTWKYYFRFHWKYWPSIKVEVISCSIIYTSPLWHLQQKVLLNLLAWLVVVDQPIREGYGFHHRSPSMWPFICITKLYVNRWAAAQDDIKLVFKAVLDATFEHELSHQYCILVCSIRSHYMKMKLIFEQ